jgi:hypothetical protein
MKEFIDFNFSAHHFKQELQDFHTFINSSQDLREKKDILPFFRKHQNLAAYLGSYFPDIIIFDKLAYEYRLFGDFVADIIVGDSIRKRYLLIELEDASKNSVFIQKGKKVTREWSPRFLHGFAQLIDWFVKLDSLRRTPDFESIFGYGLVKFEGILVAGKNSYFKNTAEFYRFDWFSDKTRVDSHAITCLTYDDIYEDLADRAKNDYRVYQIENQ